VLFNRAIKDGLIVNAGARNGDIVLIKAYCDVSTMLGPNVATPYIFSHGTSRICQR
jgi:hypothetical protein